MPAAFDLTANSEELWSPAALTAEEKVTFDNHRWTVLARLKPGVTIDAARAHMIALTTQLEKEQPLRNAERRAAVIDFTEIFVGDVRQRLYVLLGAVALVLLIACGNVANLLLARGAVRSTELAVRAAMGAGRGRLIRQLFTESLLLAGIGTIVGLVLAYAALRATDRVQPAQRAAPRSGARRRRHARVRGARRARQQHRVRPRARLARRAGTGAGRAARRPQRRHGRVTRSAARHARRGGSGARVAAARRLGPADSQRARDSTPSIPASSRAA